MNWIKNDNHIEKEFVLNDFSEAAEFVNKIAPIANKADHHPDILIHSYKKVKVMLTTHDQGKVTDKDYALADQIDKL